MWLECVCDHARTILFFISVRHLASQWLFESSSWCLECERANRLHACDQTRIYKDLFLLRVHAQSNWLQGCSEAPPPDMLRHFQLMRSTTVARDTNNTMEICTIIFVRIVVIENCWFKLDLRVIIERIFVEENCRLQLDKQATCVDQKNLIGNHNQCRAEASSRSFRQGCPSAKSINHVLHVLIVVLESLHTVVV